MLQVLKFFQLLNVLFQEHQAEADEEQQAGKPDGPAAHGGQCKAAKAGTVLTLKFEALQECRTQDVLQGGYISGAKDAKLQSTATLLVECPASRFTDVDRNEYYHEGIAFVVSRGSMLGMGGAKFQPDTETSRAMLGTVLYRIAGEPSVKGTAPFRDVEKNSWYTNAVIWAAENGIVKGVNTTTFAPNDQITREQIATILFRYAKAEKVEGKLAGFPDAGKVSDYAADAMAWAVEQGLINGISESDGKTYLAPQETATRAQIAVILMRYLTAEN